MMDRASRLTGIAFFALALAASPALAGDIASKAGEAETLLAAGKTQDAAAALDASIDAFWKQAPLSFRNALFVDAARGYGDYTAHAGTGFAAGSTLTVYAEPMFYGWGGSAGAYTIGFSATLEIHDKKGLVLTKASAPVTLQRTLADKSREFQMTVSFALPALKAGDYVLVVKVTDAATQKAGTIELPFAVSG